MSAEKGRPPGSRDQLTSDFIAKLADDFEANGEAAIERCRMDDPAAYLRLVASLAPKNVAVDDGVGLLDFFAAALDSRLAVGLEVAGELGDEGAGQAVAAPGRAALLRAHSFPSLGRIASISLLSRRSSRRTRRSSIASVV